MSIPSLHSICTQRTADFLKVGVWKRCAGSKNPFCYLPSAIVDHIMSFMLALKRPQQPKLIDFYPLLQSDRLKHIDLMEVENEIVKDAYFQILTLLSGACGQLQSLKMGDISTYPDEYLLKQLEWLLGVCPTLQDLHSPIFFDLNVLRNSKQLKVLKLHIKKWMNASFDKEVFDIFTHPPDLWRCWESLEAFAVCSPVDCVLAHRTIATMLKHCPNIISVGLVDSSMAIEYLFNTKEDGSPCKFQLRRCFWGKIYSGSLPADCSFVSRYPNRIRKAVLCCPLVEELVFEAFNKNSIIHLRHLKNLTFLEIDLKLNTDWMPSFRALLGEIGRKLKHLSLTGIEIPVDRICDLCPNLESLRVLFGTTDKSPEKSSISLPRLRSLCLEDCDSRCMLILLSSCPHLKEFRVLDTDEFSDDLLEAILTRNSFTELELAFVNRCNLSANSIKKLLQSACILKTMAIFSLCLIDFRVRNLALELNHSVTVVDDFDCMDRLEKDEFFRRKIHFCYF